MKLGIHEDSQNRAKIEDLLCYHSTKSSEELTGLKDYITRMKKGHKDVYYIIGESKKAVENSPFLERLKKKGYEVLYMVVAIDEYAMGQLKEYDDKKLVSATKEGLKLEETEEEKKKKVAYESLYKTMKDILGDKLEKVVVSERIVDLPCYLTDGEAIVLSVIRAISIARECNMFIIWFVCEHSPFGRDVEIFRWHLYADGKGPTIKGSKGAKLVDELIIREEYKLVKARFSAFFDTHLHSLHQSPRIRSLVVVGVQTTNCIRQTVFDPVASNYQPITVIVIATAAATPEVHLANILDLKNIGVPTLALEEWGSSYV